MKQLHVKMIGETNISLTRVGGGVCGRKGRGKREISGKKIVSFIKVNPYIMRDLMAVDRIGHCICSCFYQNYQGSFSF